MLDQPTLDDLRHADLMQEARALLPTLAPSWTDHNPSDPGIMLVELFAWLTELVLYRLDQVPERSTWAFLRLLNAQGWKPSPQEDLQEAIRSTLHALRTPYRAVTCQDFEQLAWRWREEAEGRASAIRRVRCVAERDLETSSQDVATPGHLSVIVVPEAEGLALPGAPSPAVVEALRELFGPRRLLTTRCHVVGPQYVPITVRAALYLRPQAVPAKVKAAASEAVRRYLHPLRGGPEGSGWPFGRSVHVSDLMTLLHDVPGVDFVGVAGESIPQDGPVQGVTLEAARTLPGGDVPLHAHELPEARVPEAGLTMMQKVRGTWRAVP
jgi:hypothetical protein